MASQVTEGTSQADRLLGRVGGAMTATVVSVSPNDSLATAARELEAAGVSGAPVLDGGTVVGIVTLGDLLSRIRGPVGRVQTTGPFHRAEPILAEISRRTGARVRDVMTTGVITVRADAPLTLAARKMADGRINRLPVIDERGTLCGILTRDDIVAAVGRLSEASVNQGPSRPRIVPD
jgi:CBS domain-containing protein